MGIKFIFLEIYANFIFYGGECFERGSPESETEEFRFYKYMQWMRGISSLLLFFLF